MFYTKSASTKRSQGATGYRKGNSENALDQLQNCALFLS